MTYQQIMSRIKELDCGDNYKLVGFILEHGVEVLSVTSDTITCNTLFGDGSKVPETIRASMPDVRAYLGVLIMVKQYTYNGEPMTLKALSKLTDIPIATIRNRIEMYGYSVEQAIARGIVKRDGSKTKVREAAPELLEALRLMRAAWDLPCENKRQREQRAQAWNACTFALAKVGE